MANLDPYPIVKSIIEDAIPGLHVSSWIADIDDREYPFVNVRPLGGNRHRTRHRDLRMPVIELTAYANTEVRDASDLYDEVLDALFDAQLYQKTTPGGYIHSIKETMGKTSFDSPFDATWRMQGLVKLGIRPPNGGS